MAALHVQLFRDFAITAPGNMPLNLGSPKTKSLLAYLILRHDQQLDRRRVAFQLWPRAGESAARRNLRQYVHRVRRSLEPIDPDSALIQTSGRHICLHVPPGWELDAAQFERAVTPPNQDLERAIALYRGELLEDVYEDWVIAERERFGRLYRDALLTLTDRLETAGDPARAIPYAQKYLDAEPYLESAHLRLMRLHYATGNRARVRQQFDALQTMLADEFGTTPLPATRAAADAMLAGTYGPPPAAPPPAVTPRPTIRPAMSGNQTALVGRAAEMEQVQRCFENATDAHGTFAIVEGELGIGKTRLSEEWLDRLPSQAPAALVFRGRAHEFESMLPYGPLAAALRDQPNIPWDLFEPSPAWLPALLPLLPDLASRLTQHGQDVPPSPVHMIQGLSNLFLALARQRPLVLFIDNLHWADTSTWHFLSYFAQRVQTSQIVVIGSIRTEDASADSLRVIRKLDRLGHLTTVSLARLSAENTTRLVRQMMQDDHLDPRLLKRLYEETEGNPFFIIETVRAIQEAGGDWTQSVPSDEFGRRPTFAIPLKVQAVIESRLDKLDEESRAALCVAAAIGRAFTFDLLQAVSRQSTDSLLNALDQWLSRGLVRETGDGYDFTHEKLSQVAYNQLSRARRRHIHLQIGDYLASQPHLNTDAAQLAHHYYLSSQPDKALPYLTQAGQRALSVRSYAVAREYGLRALGLIGRFSSQHDSAERIDLNLQLAQAYAFSGQISKAQQLLSETERLATAAGDTDRLARVFHRSAQMLWLRGLPEAASSYARRTLRHAEELGDADLRFAALRMLSRTSIALNQFDDAIAYLLRYLDLVRQTPSPPPGLPLIYGYLGVAYARVGSWQRALHAAERGVDLAAAEPSGATHTVACMQKAFIHAELREWAAALDTVEPVADIWREEGMSPHAFMLRNVTGRAMAQAGRPDEGLAEIRAALQWAESADFRVFVHVGSLFLAQALFDARDPDAMAAARHSAERARRAHDRWAEALSLRLQAEIDMQRPQQTDWVQAEALLLRAMQLLRAMRARPDLAHTYLALRRLYDRAGQVAWAVDCHFRAITIFEELGMEDQMRHAQGHAGRDRTGAIVIHGMRLKGPNAAADEAV